MMKRLAFILFCLMFVLASFAAGKDVGKAVTMVSYEQYSTDSYGSLSLKNNTNEEIRNIVFIITYLDMAGNEIDYEEFEEDVTIAPGKTKKIDIPAYERNRKYYYYKTKNFSGENPFNIKFQLKDYNVDGSVISKSFFHFLGNSSGDETGLLLVALIVAFLMFAITVAMYVLVAMMARDRGRSVLGWVVLSLFISPLIAIVILWVAGNAQGYEKESKFMDWDKDRMSFDDFLDRDEPPRREF